MKKRVILSVGLATAILTGCGSSSGGEATTGIGYYIDSAVSGVDYVCGSKSGKTRADGGFTFEVGKDCTFSLGSMKLREVKASTLKDQIKVLENNLVVATLLQTLDSDGDPDNDGIVISSKILAELKAKNITALPTNQDEVAVIYEVIKNVDGYQGSLKTEEEAQAHLDSGSSSDSAGDVPETGETLKDLLAGKTFWEVDVQVDSGIFLNKVDFNSAFNKITMISDIDSNDEKTELMDFTYSNGKISFNNGHYKQFKSKTSKYIDLSGSSDLRLYFERTDAEADLNGR
jgi:hypothetical protein